MAKVRVERLGGTASVNYIGAVYYEPHQLMSGTWQVTLKIDGARLIRDGLGVPCSRAGNRALPHIVAAYPEDMYDVELFRTNWSTSMSLKAGTIPVTEHDFYSVDPIDPRLVLVQETTLTHEYIIAMRDWAMAQGHEGIVLRQGDAWVKVVPLRRYDVRITGWYEGTGRLKGMLGGFTTHHGRVGGGFDDAMRVAIWKVCQENPKGIIGKIMQTKYREKTAAGKMRMPIWERFRFDKDTESDHGISDMGADEVC